LRCGGVAAAGTPARAAAAWERLRREAYRPRAVRRTSGRRRTPSSDRRRPPCPPPRTPEWREASPTAMSPGRYSGQQLPPPPRRLPAALAADSSRDAGSAAKTQSAGRCPTLRATPPTGRPPPAPERLPFQRAVDRGRGGPRDVAAVCLGRSSVSISVLRFCFAKTRSLGFFSVWHAIILGTKCGVRTQIAESCQFCKLRVVVS